MFLLISGIGFSIFFKYELYKNYNFLKLKRINESLFMMEFFPIFNLSVLDIVISDPLFVGKDHSTMSLLLDSAIRFNTEVALSIEPNALDGIIVHFGQSRDVRHQDFFTLMLRNGSLFMSFSLGGPRSGQSHALTLSLCCVTIGERYQIEAGRSGRDGFLKLKAGLLL